jgi:maltose O-acetyltransferase
MEAREPGATIFVDSDVWLNNGATLVAERSSIRIDRGCLIGPSVQIFDSDFHSLTPELRKSGGHECRPVHLEENVFVGTSVIILKGVTIGRNSVIAAGSVVVSDIPENSAAAGVPAKVIANLTRPMADEPTAARRPITSS